MTNRYTKMAFAKELGSIMSGGTAPLVASALLSFYGHWWPIAVYFSLMAAIGLVTTFSLRRRADAISTLPEDAI